MKKPDTITSLIEQVLAVKPITRSSDKHLILAVWHLLGLHLTEDQRATFMGLPSSETIRRVRQKLQEQGKFPPVEKVGRERRTRSLQVQQSIPQASPERVEKLVQGDMGL